MKIKLDLQIISFIYETIPEFISLLLIRIPYWLERAMVVGEGLNPRENRNDQKSLPGKYLKRMIGIMIFLLMIMDFHIDFLDDHFLDNSFLILGFRYIYTRCSKTWIYDLVIVGLTSVSFFWHCREIRPKHSEKPEIRKRIFEKIVKFFSGVSVTDRKLPLKNEKDIGGYINKFKKWLSSKEPYYGYADEGKNVWLLKDNYVQVRSLYSMLCYFAYVAAVSLALISDRVDWSEGAILVLACICTLGYYFYECYSYYNGYTLEEYKEKIREAPFFEKDVEAPEERTQPAGVSCFMWQETSQETGKNREAVMDIIEKCGKDPDYRIRCMGWAWADSLTDSREDVDIDFMRAALQLVKHQSVYFATSFFRDMGKYIFPFINLELLENQRVLIISGGQEDGAALKEWMRRGIQERYGYLEFWDIKMMDENIKTADIGIVTMEEINKLKSLSFIESFLRHVSVVILLEPSCYFSSQSVVIAQILAGINMDQKTVTYIVCDRNIAGMVDALSETLKHSFVYVEATSVGQKTMNIIVDVDREADKKSDFKAGTSSGCRNELEYVRKKENRIAGKIRWYNHRVVPIWDVRRKIGEHSEYSGTRDAIEFCDSEIMTEREECFVGIIEDHIYNASELLRQYGSRGYQYSRCAVFSPNYLLRDFMGAMNGRTIAQILPRFQYSDRNMSITIACRLMRGSVGWTEVRWILDYYKYGVMYQEEKFVKALNSVYKEKLHFDKVQVMIDYADGRKGSLKEEKRLHFVSEDARNEFRDWYMENIEYMHFHNEEFESKGCFGNMIPGGHAYQYFLPDQFVAVNGKYYKISDISKRNNGMEVHLRRAAEFFTSRRYYRQCKSCRIELCSENSERKFNDYHDIRVSLEHANLRIITEGYIVSEKFNDWNNNNFVKTDKIPNRSYTEKSILMIRVDKKYARRLAVFLKEIFFTLFPDVWPLLSVAMNAGMYGRIDAAELEKAEGGQGTNEKDGWIYVIEDSPMDIGLPDTIGTWFHELIDIAIEYQEWLKKDEGNHKEWRKVWDEVGE